MDGKPQCGPKTESWRSGNAHKDKVKLTFSHRGGASQILTSSSTRASEETRGQRSICSRAIRLMSVL